MAPDARLLVLLLLANGRCGDGLHQRPPLQPHIRSGAGDAGVASLNQPTNPHRLDVLRSSLDIYDVQTLVYGVGKIEKIDSGVGEIRNINSGVGDKNANTFVKIREKICGEGECINRTINEERINIDIGENQDIYDRTGDKQKRNITAHEKENMIDVANKQMTNPKLATPRNIILFTFDEWLSSFMGRLAVDTVFNVLKIGGLTLLYYIAPEALDFINSFNY